MSWLNLNDSLNTLKGQISNFANNVLADDESTGTSSSSTELSELQKLCKNQQEEINLLKQLNAQLGPGRNHSSLPKNDVDQSNVSWSWDVSDIPTAEGEKTEEIADLKKTILDLTNEKQELMSNLVMLDSEHQLSDEKLIALKKKLQNEFNELEDKYDILQKENESLREKYEKNNMLFEDSKAKYELSRKSKIDASEACTKCKTLLQENQKFTSEIQQLKNDITGLESNKTTLQKALEDDKNVNDELYTQMEEKLKLFEAENKILISELKKTQQSISEFETKSEIDAENCRKLAIILEGYEQQVSSLKEDSLVKNSETINKMKSELEELQKQLQQNSLEKELTHTKYVNILTENMKKYIDSDKLYEEVENSEDEIDPNVIEFNHQVRSILNILLDLKSKCESLETELYNVTQEKTMMLTEKNHEIEKLIQNSEILSQEVITKTQTIKDYENECNELVKNNDILINELNMYKSKTPLHTISESNEDNMLLLESQLENANKKIEELENIVSQKELTFTDFSFTEVDEKYVTKTSYDILLEDLNQLKEENYTLVEEVKKIEESNTLKSEEREHWALMLEKMKTDLENTEYQYTEINVNMDVLKEEVENYKKKNEDLLGQKLSVEKLNLELERSNEDTRSEVNVFREKLLLEEDARKQCEGQIRCLTEKLQNAKMCETSFKLQFDTLSKEIRSVAEEKSCLESSLKNNLSSLNQYREEVHTFEKDNENLKARVEELERKLEDEQKKVMDIKQVKQIDELEIDENVTVNGDNQFQTVNLLEQTNGEMDNTSSSSRFDELKELYDSVLKENDRLKGEIEKLGAVAVDHINCSQTISLLEKQIEELDTAKTKLTNVIITKHQESVTYHNEIQRLTQILNSEAEKKRNLETQIQNTKIEHSENQKKEEEIEKLTDQNNFLRQKCEVLAQNLLEEQSRVQKILVEHSASSEKEQGFAKKLERLQTHLIEVEEHYTQELLRAEERNSELQSKVNEIEQREKNSSTMYTSVSIRANQHVETLQHQLQLITNQRDELRKKISDAEDHSSKQEAALANLQFVLEQFQKDKEKDVQKETERIRRQINTEKKVQEDLKHEMAGLQSQLEDSKHGLLAASRLSDQLEQSKQLVATLKTEVSQLKEKLQKNEAHLHNLSSQSDGKVDKSLIKNLVIGFVSTNNNLTKDQIQILKIIATVLDFNQQDHDKVNLSKSQQGWLSSLLSPQTSQGMSQESLSQAFVKFLENESKPRLVPSLLNNNGETPKSRRTSSTSLPRQSPNILSEVVLPTFADFAQNRNSSSILKDVLKDNS